MSFGNITREFTVWCVCGRWEQYDEPTKKRFIACIKEVGWKLIGGKWNCPRCIKKGVTKSPEKDR